MLVVRTTIRQSDIHGSGVFAAEPIKAGSLVWVYTPRLDAELQLTRFPDVAQDFIRHYGNEVSPGFYLLCGDGARYMNHSEQPTITSDGDRNYALRDISVGEEITCDYREFDIAFEGFSNDGRRPMADIPPRGHVDYRRQVSSRNVRQA